MILLFTKALVMNTAETKETLNIIENTFLIDVAGIGMLF
jgi:hypothetical protein